MRTMRIPGRRVWMREGRGRRRERSTSILRRPIWMREGRGMLKGRSTSILRRPLAAVAPGGPRLSEALWHQQSCGASGSLASDASASVQQGDTYLVGIASYWW